MATQNVTIQTDQAVAEIQSSTLAKIEATGKTTADLMMQMKATHQPVFLNLENGESLVVLAASDYQRLLEEAELSDLDRAVEEAFEDIEQGRVYTRAEVDAEMRQRFPFLAKKYETK